MPIIKKKFISINGGFYIFSHIYIEKTAYDYPLTKKILSSFPRSIQIEIRHYKDVFCRGGQNFFLQKQNPKLILAVKQDNYYHKGSDLCDNFGYQNFVYTTQIMNCFYDCEYCYLQGMYNSANPVIFVNHEDYHKELKKILPAYICVSYDTDLLAFEYLTGFTNGWINFCRQNKNAIVELRTKSAAFNSIEKQSPCENFILAWTISPEIVIKKFEHKTASLHTRLENIRLARDYGWNTRLCVDPIIKFDNYEKHYSDLFNTIRKTFSLTNNNSLKELSIGTFRVPKKLYQNMQKVRPLSEIFAYPVEEKDGIMRYPDEDKMYP